MLLIMLCIYLLGERIAGVEFTDMKLLRGFSFSWLLIDGVALSFPLNDGAIPDEKEMRHAELGRFITVNPVFVYDEGLFGALIRHTICTFE